MPHLPSFFFLKKGKSNFLGENYFLSIYKKCNHIKLNLSVFQEIVVPHTISSHIIKLTQKKKKHHSVNKIINQKRIPQSLQYLAPVRKFLPFSTPLFSLCTLAIYAYRYIYIYNHLQAVTYISFTGSCRGW